MPRADGRNERADDVSIDKLTDQAIKLIGMELDELYVTLGSQLLAKDSPSRTAGVVSDLFAFRSLSEQKNKIISPPGRSLSDLPKGSSEPHPEKLLRRPWDRTTRPRRSSTRSPSQNCPVRRLSMLRQASSATTVASSSRRTRILHARPQDCRVSSSRSKSLLSGTTIQPTVPVSPKSGKAAKPSIL